MYKKRELIIIILLMEADNLTVLRVQFNRGEEVKFVSHLDLMMVFERALRRSGLPIAYSQGFNPHPGLIFGLPLSVGVIGEAEYADMEFVGNLTPEELIERLNPQLPLGIQLLTAKEREEKANIMSLISAARYEIGIRGLETSSSEELEGLLKQTMAQELLIIPKKTKGGIKDVDIKPMIYNISAAKKGETPVISMLVSAGSKANLKPEQVIDAISRITGIKLECIWIKREKLYIGERDMLVEPISVGEVYG